MNNVVTIIVTHNPNLNILNSVINSVIGQVSRIIIIDNGSFNAKFVKELCNSSCEFIEIGFNSGIAHALKIGVEYSIKYSPEWLLFLDDDTILINNAISITLNIINKLPKSVKNKIGAVLMGSEGNSCSVWEARYGTFSGTLIRPEVALKACCRDDFFLDQADFDMYARIRELGYLTLAIKCKLIDHKLGIKRWIPPLSKIRKQYVSYEPPWRYYYIVRNSTILLMEGRIKIHSYLIQMLSWGIKIALVDGPHKLIKPLGLGILHALLGKTGYLDKEFIK